VKCTHCLYEENCSLKEIAKDITGCDGHSKERPPKENQVRCLSCKRWVDKNKTFERKDGKHCCFDCY
jgi:hypothetical protein